jgi:hypothetical protein
MQSTLVAAVLMIITEVKNIKQNGKHILIYNHISTQAFSEKQLL